MNGFFRVYCLKKVLDGRCFFMCKNSNWHFPDCFIEGKLQTKPLNLQVFSSAEEADEATDRYWRYGKFSIIEGTDPADLLLKVSRHCG